MADDNEEIICQFTLVIKIRGTPGNRIAIGDGICEKCAKEVAFRNPTDAGNGLDWFAHHTIICNQSR